MQTMINTVRDHLLNFTGQKLKSSCALRDNLLILDHQMDELFSSGLILFLLNISFKKVQYAALNLSLEIRYSKKFKPNIVLDYFKIETKC